MILYIHGFGSSGNIGKALEFRDYFKSINEPLIAPSLSYVPELAMDTLEQLVESYEKVSLIGSSLGGYYSIYLAEKYGLKAALINPAVKSTNTLKRLIDPTGYAKNYYDDSQFSWSENHVEMLKKYNHDKILSNDYLLLLQKGDDLLDYNDALQKLPNAALILEEKGNHSFENIERHFEGISEFLL